MESVTASAGVSAQLQIAGTKTALNVQKQEGENANNLIQSAVEGTEDTAASTDAAQATGNNVDTLV
ncbi:MAG: hypothetical protein CMH77_01315 [Nitrospinae bacterium]|mgnify:CR=1 FL=1|nr:hypothetical protein [Nitrospinota bacterium]